MSGISAVLLNHRLCHASLCIAKVILYMLFISHKNFLGSFMTSKLCIYYTWPESWTQQKYVVCVCVCVYQMYSFDNRSNMWILLSFICMPLPAQLPFERISCIADKNFHNLCTWSHLRSYVVFYIWCNYGAFAMY